MFKSRKEADYTLDVTPYLPWVRAFGQLILEIYEERKSVGKTWRAFKEARPEFEQLDRASFEDMLLLSLFLSEWNKSGETANTAFDSTVGRASDPQNKTKDELDKVIQLLHNVTEERDISLAAALNLEEKSKILASENEDLERRLESLEAESESRKADRENGWAAAMNLEEKSKILASENKDLERRLESLRAELESLKADRENRLAAALNLEEKSKIITSEKEDLERRLESLEAESESIKAKLAVANKGLRPVLIEIQRIREENTALKQEAVGLRKKEASLATQLESLGAELEKARSEEIIPPTDTIAVQPLTRDSHENDAADSPPMPDIKRDPSPSATRADTASAAPSTSSDVPSARIEAMKEAGYQLTLGDTVEQIPPKKIGMWNAQRSKDGYYRLYRKIKGKVHSIYIGSKLDTAKAEKRIAEKEKTLLATECPESVELADKRL